MAKKKGKNKYRALRPGNQSAADDLFDLGEEITHAKVCQCEGCKANLQHLKETYKESIMDLAEKWFLLKDKASAAVFKGLMDGWTEAQCAEAVGIKDFKLKAA